VLNQIVLGDCLKVLSTLADASVDCVITDPPYGLGTKEPTLEEILAYLQGSELDTGGDFMGRNWSIPSVAVWRECFRVLKPGGHLLSFGGTRTFDLISVGIRAAGFDSRDTVAEQFGVMCLEWLYGQGFPKSLNIAKAAEKAGVAPELVEKWRGWGTALKPSWEPILVFRKPIAEPTIMGQVVLATGTGGINIDALRLGRDAIDSSRDGQGSQHKRYTKEGGTNFAMKPGPLGGDPRGRWPANVLLVHAAGCKQVGFKKVPAPVINRFDDGMKPFGDGAGHSFTSTQTGDADGMEEISVYECVPECPVKLLDGQSGVSTSSGGRFGNIKPSDVYGSGRGIGANSKLKGDEGDPGFGDTGGASRFFGQFEPDAPFFYTAKVSKSERNRGVTSRRFQKGCVVVREDLAEEEAKELLSKWPEDLPHPFAFDFGGESRIPIEKKQVPEALLDFFEDLLPDTNLHPTVKPLALMIWLVRLVAPKGATVLDPYCGSGTTCVAALEADCNYIGIERDPVSHETATKRIAGLRAGIEARADERRAREAFALMQELAEQE
jgi:DNA modification methylase